MTVRLDVGNEVDVWALQDQFNQERPLGASRRYGLWDFGYALTVHKAQGSEANSVLVIDQPIGRTFDERRRWLYTAVTRAKSKLLVAEKVA